MFESSFRPSSGHDLAVTCTNMQQLWLHNICTGMGPSTLHHGSHWQLTVIREGNVIFVSGVATAKLLFFQ